MSLSPFTNGTYQIFNVMYSTQNAELLSPGGVDGVLGGYHNNSDSGRMQWVVESAGKSLLGPVITIYNQEIKTYAGIPYMPLIIPTGTPVQGEQDYVLEVMWDLSSVDGNNKYLICLSENINMVWTLGDGNDGTHITLEETSATTGAQANQQWIFVPL